MSFFEINNLSVGFKNKNKILLHNIFLSINEGQVMGLVGESGSGKTMLSLALMGLLPKNIKILNGSIKLDGKELYDYKRNKIYRNASDITMIFQNPKNALNPTMKIGDQISNVIKYNKTKYNNIKNTVYELLDEVGIPGVHRIYGYYPHQLSGGMCQRIMIAMALACKPKILIADEPTTALDVTIQAQIFALIKKLILKTKSSILFISHDLDAIAEISNDVAVMFSGQMMEQAHCKDIVNRPKHPYTKFLIDSIINSGKEEIIKREKSLYGCQYSYRCESFSKICEESNKLLTINKNHKSSCIKNIVS